LITDTYSKKTGNDFFNSINTEEALENYKVNTEIMKRLVKDSIKDRCKANDK